MIVVRCGTLSAASRAGSTVLMEPSLKPDHRLFVDMRFILTFRLPFLFPFVSLNKLVFACAAIAKPCRVFEPALPTNYHCNCKILKTSSSYYTVRAGMIFDTRWRKDESAAAGTAVSHDGLFCQALFTSGLTKSGIQARLRWWLWWI